MESTLGPWKGSVFFGCGALAMERLDGIHLGALERLIALVAGLGDGEVGCNPPALERLIVFDCKIAGLRDG